MGHGLKILGPSEKTHRYVWCPKLITGLHILNRSFSAKQEKITQLRIWWRNTFCDTSQLVSAEWEYGHSKTVNRFHDRCRMKSCPPKQCTSKCCHGCPAAAGLGNFRQVVDPLSFSTSRKFFSKELESNCKSCTDQCNYSTECFCFLNKLKASIWIFSCSVGNNFNLIIFVFTILIPGIPRNNSINIRRELLVVTDVLSTNHKLLMLGRLLWNLYNASQNHVHCATRCDLCWRIEPRGQQLIAEREGKVNLKSRARISVTRAGFSLNLAARLQALFPVAADCCEAVFVSADKRFLVLSLFS